MYKIGEFSKMTNLTIKALHYYDEQGLLTPSKDEDNNYRLYCEEDFEKAKLIKLLRDLDFSISEIKDVLKECTNTNDADLSYYIMQKCDIITNRINKDKKMLKMLSEYLPNENNKEERKMDYKVEIKELQDVVVLSKRFKGAYSDVSKYIGELFKEAKGNVNGTVFNLYYDDDYAEVADIELCLPVKPNTSSNKFDVKNIEGGKYLSTLYIGEYDKIGVAYKAIIDYANENNLEITIPTRLIYKKGPGMILIGNPNKYETEVLIPIK